MIKFEKIRFKNLLSFGDQWTEIQFAGAETTLITGKNGSGKSTFLDALTIALYGKPFRKINKPQIVNSINNKGLLIELDFMVGTTNYQARRGIKPNIFEIIENGEVIDQTGSVNDYQAFFEKNILKMNYTAFTQIVILGKASYIPFMRLPLPQRRAVIEDLLGLTIFTSMNTVVKAKVTELKRNQQKLDGDISVIDEKITVRKEYIRKLEENRENHLAQIAEDIERLESDITEHEGKVSKYTDERATRTETGDGLSKMRGKYRKLEKFDVQFNSKMEALRKEIKFLTDNEICPTCDQDITQAFRVKRTNINEDEVEKIENGKKKLKTDLSSVGDDILAIENELKEIQKLDVKISSEQAGITKCQQQIKRMNAQRNKLTSADVKGEQKKVDGFVKEEMMLKDKQIEMTETGAYYTAIVSMLKDSGIKTLIIQKYLPIFNRLINQYLNQMGFFIKFELDEQFNETILSRYRDKFSYDSFSEGQKLRIDLAILLTWREIAKLKNSLNTNLLIMDEVFDSSLDQEGVDAFVTMIPQMDNTNVFVVSHTPDKLVDKFKNQINFKLEQNFSIAEV